MAERRSFARYMPQWPAGIVASEDTVQHFTAALASEQEDFRVWSHWGLISQRHSGSADHYDAAGVSTYVQGIVGQKLWALSRLLDLGMPGAPDDVKFWDTVLDAMVASPGDDDQEPSNIVISIEPGTGM